MIPYDYFRHPHCYLPLLCPSSAFIYSLPNKSPHSTFFHMFPFKSRILCCLFSFSTALTCTMVHFTFLSSAVTPSFIFAPEDFMFGASNDRWHVTFVCLGLSYLTKDDLFYFDPYAIFILLYSFPWCICTTFSLSKSRLEEIYCCFHLLAMVNCNNEHGRTCFCEVECQVF